MNKFVKTALTWIIIFPILTTTLLIITDYFKDESIEITSYLPNILGFAVGGLFVGFVMYQLQKLQDENNKRKIRLEGVLKNWAT
ncbi:hypothetical protein BKP45_08145 [Anaerobacillus alkalidiazotrophicus]|uniref:Uncharacterized protein n=1 Tax=Anaerobacillus alkalidiazotrophicus TaxID=472963 RepID=A0A1S2M8C3_9BACI|nr:hypothetical protein [Anaerobacillus alkalidiazotrophicus]OIJ20760.1 hypothetical protein BKP45_08145 [Anaerobacillus alkalidiazotrophicus]